jgi:hypothetical protein
VNDVKTFSERLLKVIDEALADNNKQVLLGMCPDFETYKYVTGTSQALLLMKDRIKSEFLKMQKEQLDGE